MRINPEEILELIDAAHEYNCKQEDEQFIFVSEITSTNYTIGMLTSKNPVTDKNAQTIIKRLGIKANTVSVKEVTFDSFNCMIRNADNIGYKASKWWNIVDF